MTMLGVLIAALGAVHVQLAPDQPIPYVYVDEPLIVEFKSDEDITTPIHVDIEGGRDKAVSLDFGPVSLRAHGTYWQTVDGAPTPCGLYTVKVTVPAANQQQTYSFCRIARPTSSARPPWGIAPAEVDTPTLAAVSALPARLIHLDSSAPDIEGQAIRAADAGFQVSITLDASRQGTDGTAEALSKKLGERVTRWEVLSAENADRIGPVAQAIQRGGSRAQVALVASDPKSFGAALSAGAGQYAKSVVVSNAPKRGLAAFRNAAESAGYESFPIIVWEKETAENDGKVSFAQRLAEYLSDGASETDFAGAGLYRDRGFQPAFPQMNALARQLSGAVFVGDMAIEDGVSAYVFRNGGAWLISIWAGASAEIKLQVGDAANLAMSDGANNPLEVSDPKDGAIALRVQQGATYLKGVGGTVLADAARKAVREDSKSLAENKSFQKFASKEFVELVKNIVQLDAGKSSRMEYLALLRGFTTFEELWHSGKVPRGAAVPVLAALSRVSRGMCVLQQEGGEPFVEPLRKTLARCGEYQSQYLTSSGGAQGARERGDWLSQEVSRLTAEAEALEKDGRSVEAAAVAALAEWRARSLEYAAKAAPLSKPDPFAQLLAGDDGGTGESDRAETKSTDEKKANGAKPAQKKQPPPGPGAAKKKK